MKKFILMLPLIASVMMWNGMALAKEHGGEKAGGGEHGGKAMEGSHGMTEDHAATLNEAAKVLREAGRSDLADKLEAMAKMEE